MDIDQSLTLCGKLIGEWDTSKYQGQKLQNRVKEVRRVFEDKNQPFIPDYQLLYMYVEKKTNEDLEVIVDRCIGRLWLEKYIIYYSLHGKKWKDIPHGKKYPYCGSNVKVKISSGEIEAITDWLNKIENKGIDKYFFHFVEHPPPNFLAGIIETVLVQEF